MESSPKQLVEHAKERFALQDYYGCIHLLNDVIQTGKGYADAHQLLGLALQMIGQPEKALESLDRALELNPSYVEAWIHKGLVLNDLGRADEGREAFGRADGAKDAPREGLPAHHASRLANQHAELGEAYAEVGALDAAIEQYRAAMKLGPTFHDLRYRLARLLSEAGRDTEAREQLVAVVKARPGFFEARAALGMACYQSGDRESAVSIWTDLERDRPDDIRVRAYLAMAQRGKEAAG